MEIIKKKIGELKPAHYNPRRMPEKEMKRLQRSIEEFGYVEPIVWNRRTDRVVGGHQRLEALRSMLEGEIKDSPAMEEVEVVVVDLDEEKEKALNLALNKIHGDWDAEKLGEILGFMDDEGKELAGFDELDIKRILVNFEATEKELDPETGAGLGTMSECPRCGYRY